MILQIELTNDTSRSSYVVECDKRTVHDTMRYHVDNISGWDDIWFSELIPGKFKGGKCVRVGRTILYKSWNCATQQWEQP
jgi:hypothetical protein